MVLFWSGLDVVKVDVYVFRIVVIRLGCLNIIERKNVFVIFTTLFERFGFIFCLENGYYKVLILAITWQL